MILLILQEMKGTINKYFYKPFLIWLDTPPLPPIKLLSNLQKIVNGLSSMVQIVHNTSS